MARKRINTAGTHTFIKHYREPIKRVDLAVRPFFCRNSKMGKKFQAILFDMDGVLIDSMGNHAKAWTIACEESGIFVDQAEMYRREGELEERSGKDFIKSAGLMQTKARVRELVRRKDEAFSRLPAPHPFPGAVETVRELSSAGYKLGVVTGSSRTAFEQLMPKEILENISVSVCGDEIRHGKPNPEPYLKGIIALSLPSSSVVVIENAPFGIQAARAAGAYVIAVRSYLSDEDLQGAHQFVDDIRQLPALFRAED